MIIGIKSGCFTLLGAHHVRCLNDCKTLCDLLIVCINDDDYIMRKKGCVPICAQDRKTIISNLKCVDGVVIFHEDTEDSTIAKLVETPFFKQHCTKLLVFHSDEHINKKNLPGQKYADEIIYIHKGEESTSNVFRIIKSAKK